MDIGESKESTPSVSMLSMMITTSLVIYGQHMQVPIVSLIILGLMDLIIFLRTLVFLEVGLEEWETK